MLCLRRTHSLATVRELVQPLVQQCAFGAAERHTPRTPQRIAQLLQTSIDWDMGTKRGVGKPPRTLEALTVLVTDTIRSA